MVKERLISCSSLTGGALLSGSPFLTEAHFTISQEVIKYKYNMKEVAYEHLQNDYHCRVHSINYWTHYNGSPNVKGGLLKF